MYELDGPAALQASVQLASQPGALASGDPSAIAMRLPGDTMTGNAKKPVRTLWPGSRVSGGLQLVGARAHSGPEHQDDEATIILSLVDDVELRFD
jgi:hypothetical protein